MKVGIGQDSHRFLKQRGEKICVIGGVEFPDVPGLDADSNGDVVYHALCNAITSITHVQILGDIAIKMCKRGILDSKEYLIEAKKSLGETKISHIAITIEGKRPRMQASLHQMRVNIANIFALDISSVGITCTSGNNLGDFGLGLGIQSYCILSIA
jgi:2-C-methyl-D-erythritol 2,4-cyclodiphosphate synthase